MNQDVDIRPTQLLFCIFTLLFHWLPTFNLNNCESLSEKIIMGVGYWLTLIVLIAYLCVVTVNGEASEGSCDGKIRKSFFN